MPRPKGGFKERLAVADSGPAAHAVVPAIFDFRVAGRALKGPLALPTVGAEVNLPAERKGAATVEAHFRGVRLRAGGGRGGVERKRVLG